MRRLSGSARAATGMLVVLALGWAAVAPVQAVSASAAPSLDPPTLVAPRLAFTDDSDELVVRRTETYCPSGSCTDTEVLSGGDHTGEASATRYAPPQDGGSDSQRRDVITYVSSADDAAGEVYLLELDPPGDKAVRLTCNTEVESHPVLSPDGRMVAYASRQPSGAWQIWVVWIRVDDTSDTLLPCAQIPRVQLTTRGSNTWPTWLGTDRIAFSSTRNDPLGDLYAVQLGPRGAPVDDAGAVQLTFGTAAETQPVAVASGSDHLIVFTTTEFRHDGSLAGIRVREDEGGALTTGLVASLWPSDPPQSSEAAFDTRAAESVGNPYATGLAFGYSTSSVDPFGDVVTTVLAPTSAPGPPPTGEPTATPSSGGPTDPTTVPTTGAPSVGLAAADPTIDFGYEADEASTKPVSGQLGRSESHVALAHGYGTDVAVFTRRSHSADVADVVAADGSGRRKVASGSMDLGEGASRERDESAPTYSPDGSRIAYSRTTPSGREIVTANPDGSDIRPLLADGPADAVDLQPAWSPDGTRIAFVRAVSDAGRPVGPTEVWVGTLASGSATRVTVPVPDHRIWDEHPSWSPDSSRLVVSRAVAVLKPDLVVSLAAPDTATTGQPFTVTATVTNQGHGSTGSRDAVVRLSSSASDGAADFTFEPNGGECVLDSDGHAVCRVGPLRAGESRAVSVKAQGVSTGRMDASVDPMDEERTDNNSASVAIVVIEPDVAVSLDLPTTFVSGGSRGATLRVHNVGTAVANGVQVNVTAVSEGGSVNFSDVPSGCTISDSSHATCRQTSILPGAELSWGFTVVGVNVGSARVTAVAPTLPGEVTVDNNTTSATTTVDYSSPGLSLPRGRTPVLTAVARAQGRASLTRLAHPPVPTVRPAAVRAVSVDPDPGVPRQLWVLDAVTGAGAQIVVKPTCPPTRVCDPSPIEGRVPAWSPDGLRIAYELHGSVIILGLADTDANGVADQPERAATVSVVTGLRAGGTATPSRATISSATDPAWSPDAAELAISGQPAGLPDDQGIYAVRPDGTGLRLVAQERGPETEPAWQPYADVAVALVAVPAAGDTGFATVITATVTNDGPSPTRALRMLLQLPTGVDAGAPPAGCTVAGGVLTCDVASLASRGSLSFAIPATVATEGGHSVAATVAAVGPDPRPDNNTAEVAIAASTAIADLGVTLSATPTDGGVGFDTLLEARVTNSGPREAMLTTLRLSLPPGLTPGPTPTGCAVAGPVLTCGLPVLAAGSTETRSWPVRGAVVGSHVVTAEVSSSMPDPVTANNVAQATVTVREGLADLTVAVTTTSPGYVGGTGTTTVTVTNLGPQPVSDATLTLVHPPSAMVGVTASQPCLTGSSPCPVGSLAPQASTSFTTETAFRGAGAGDVIASVTSSMRDPVPGDNRAVAPLVVKQPVVRPSPNVVAPSGVTVVTGQDFPPGTAVILGWDVGIVERRGPVTVRADGTFGPVQVVILRRDRLGLRNLTATGSVAGQFTPAQAELLVAPRNLSAPSFVERN